MQILTISKMWKNGNLTYFEAAFDNFCNGVQETADMIITSNMSSVGNNKELDGEILHFRSRSRS